MAAPTKKVCGSCLLFPNSIRVETILFPSRHRSCRSIKFRPGWLKEILDQAAYGFCLVGWQQVMLLANSS
jgi:hypothetical protein